MKVTISHEKLRKFTSAAQKELQDKTRSYADKVIEEAECIEASRCGDLTKIEITPHIVKRASEYVIEQRVEKIRPHWFPAIVCPFIDGLAGVGISFSLEHQDKCLWLLIISSIVLFGILVYQLTYHVMNK